MRHIKLFEAFTNDTVTDYRVSYVDPGMKEGYYLFSTIDPANEESIFGVFDLKGLKELEDSINTEIIVHDLVSKVQNIDGTSPNPEETYDNFSITPISKKSKFMRICEEEGLEWEITWNRGDVEKDLGLFGLSIYDLPDVELGTMKLKDQPFGAYLKRHIISMGLVLLPSETRGDEGNFLNIPIVLNQCHFMSYHGDVRSGSSSSVSDQINTGFGEAQKDFLESIADLSDIEKYLPKIFDRDVPNGFLKILNRLKSSGSASSGKLERFKKEFAKLQDIDFERASASAKKSYERMIPSIPPPRAGDGKDLERYKKEYNEAQIEFHKKASQEIKDQTNDVLLDMQNLINRYKGIVTGYSFKDEQDFIDYHVDIQNRGIKGLPPKDWPSGRKWPPGTV